MLRTLLMLRRLLIANKRPPEGGLGEFVEIAEFVATVDRRRP
jgi:hypothetical protein